MAPLLLFFFAILITTIFFISDGRRRSRLRPPLPPGPKGWPLLGYLPHIGRNPHQIFHRLSKTYGPLFHLRLGSVDVVVPCSAAVAEKLMRNDIKFINRPKNAGAEYVAYNYQDIGFLPYGTKWRVERKLCALHLFSPKALDEFQYARKDECRRLVRSLAARGTEGPEAAVEVGKEIAACVVNSLSMLLVGRRVFDDGPEVEKFRYMVIEMMGLVGCFCITDFLPGLEWLDPQGLIARMKKLNGKFDEFLDNFIAEHRAALAENPTKGSVDVSKPNTKDFLSVILQHQENADGEGGKVTDLDIKALMLAMFSAGTDSTSVTSEWAMSELIRKPHILARAQAELDSVVGRDRLVAESDLPNLPLLNAIVKETLRLHPPAPLSIPRTVGEDFEVDGYLIPKGATLLANIWAIGRDPAYWHDEPLEFRPSKFLPGGSHEGVDSKGTHSGLITFGIGRRACVGMNLGLRMISIITATLVHSFDWSLPEGQKAEDMNMEENLNGITLMRIVPLVARPSPRLAPELYLMA